MSEEYYIKEEIDIPEDYGISSESPNNVLDEYGNGSLDEDEGSNFQYHFSTDSNKEDLEFQPKNEFVQ